MFSQVECDYVFEHFAQNTCEWYRAIICRVWFASFFENGGHICPFQIWGSFTGSCDFWKIICSIGASSAWRVCRTMGLNWSGPAALRGFRDLSSFSMPFTEICISGIWLHGLAWKGKLHPWSFSSWNFWWAKELKRSGDLGLTIDWNCLFRAFDFS